MKCLVTGANGFLGTNLVIALCEQGWQVYASGRTTQANPFIADLPISYQSLDITDAQGVDAAVRNVDVVFHVAGDTSFWKPLYPQQRATNVDGTLNVAHTCLKHGKRMVHTSTADVFGYREDGECVDEHGTFNFTGMDYHYGETKHEADMHLHRLHQQGLDVVLLHPGTAPAPQTGIQPVDSEIKNAPGTGHLAGRGKNPKVPGKTKSDAVEQLLQLLQRLAGVHRQALHRRQRIAATGVAEVE